MPSKKPSPANPPKSTSAFPIKPKKGNALADNALKKPDNRWQRTKRYGWDSR